MAKKKETGQQPKPYPLAGQTWTDTSGKTDVKVTVDRRETDSAGKECWHCTRSNFDDSGKPKVETCVLYLEDFADSFIQLDEPAKEAPPVTPLEALFQIQPDTKGSMAKCPSPTCNDTHRMNHPMTWEDFKKEVEAMIKRHEEHAREGLLGM